MSAGPALPAADGEPPAARASGTGHRTGDPARSTAGPRALPGVTGLPPEAADRGPRRGPDALGRPRATYLEPEGDMEGEQ